jgi:predicted nicotinamide N-methyase
MIDWRAFPTEEKGYDLILASDVLYEKEYARLLPGIFKRALAPGGMVLLADPGRIGVPEFRDECTVTDLVIRDRTTIPFQAGEIRQQIDLYEIADAKS